VDGATHFFVPTLDGPAGDAVDLVARQKALTRWEARKALYDLRLPSAPLPPLSSEAVHGIARYFRATPLRTRPPYTDETVTMFRAHQEANGDLIFPLQDAQGFSGVWTADRGPLGQGVVIGFSGPLDRGGRSVIFGGPEEAMAYASLYPSPTDACFCIASPEAIPALQANVDALGWPVVLASADVRRFETHLRGRCDHEIEPRAGGWRAELAHNPPPTETPTEPSTKKASIFSRITDVLKPR
jgi:hypothetical protein